MEDERRQHQRVPLLLDVVWEGGAGRYEVHTTDVGMGGCFIDSLGQVTVGEALYFKLRLPGGRWVEFRGKVASAFPNIGFGVRFLNMSEEARASIAQLLESAGA